MAGTKIDEVSDTKGLPCPMAVAFLEFASGADVSLFI